MAGVVAPSRAASHTVESSRAARRLDVQGLRAVAVLMVVGFHAGLPIPGGFVGVDVFFVISGFVITGMLAREWAATGRIRFGQFYLRRFQRLTPALAVMVSLTVVGSTVLLSPVGPQQVAAETGLGAILLVANLVIAASTGGYFDQAAELNPLLHTWSLSVEEQFYLVFPLILASGWAAVTKHRGTRLAPSFLVGVVGLASLSLAVLGALEIHLPGLNAGTLGFYSPLTRAWEFAAGAGLALLAPRLTLPSRGTSRLTGALGALLIASSLLVITERTTFPGFAALLPVTGSLLVLYAGCNPNNAVSRFLSSSPATSIGDWSYSLYLWHWPFIAFAGLLWRGQAIALVLAAAASWVPALVSYRWIEQPIRKMRSVERPHPDARHRFRALVAITVLTPLVLTGTFRLAAANGYWNQEVRAFQTSKTPHPVTLCDPRDRVFCHWNAEASGPPIYLVGDSHAGHFDTAVIDAGVSLKRPVAISMAYNCPFVRGIEVALAGEGSACLTHNERVLKALVGATPGAVVIAGADTYWTGEAWVVSDAGAVSSVGPEAKLRVWERALERTIESLQQAGHAVLLVQTVPLHERYDPERCSTVKIRRDGCSNVLSEAEVLRTQGDARAVVIRVADETGSTLLDPWPLFCRDGRCTTSHDSEALYTNWSHISVSASSALANKFGGALQGAG